METDAVDRLLAQWRRETPEADVSGLALVVRIEMLAKLLKRDTSRSLSKTSLKAWEYDVLSALRRQGRPFELPASDLARASMLSPGAMTTRIDQLEARRLVQRRPDAEDGRSVRVGLTAAGRKLIDKAIHSRFDAASSFASELKPAERRALENALRKLLLSLARQADGSA